MHIRRLALSLVVAAAALWPQHGDTLDLGLQVTPGKLEASIPTGTTYNLPITIRNSGVDATHVQATMVDFGVTTGGDYQFDKVGTRPYSLMKWSAIRPREFDIPAGTSQQVQLTMQIPADSKLSGEYAGIVFFQTRPSRQRNQTVAFSERIASKIYVTIPNTVKIDGAITKMNATSGPIGETYRVLFHNTGNSHVYLRGQLLVQKPDSSTVEQIALPENQLVERGGDRLLEIGGKRLSPGKYQAIATIDYGGKTDTAGGVQFEVR